MDPETRANLCWQSVRAGAAGFLVACFPVHAQPIQVDAELVLAADISLSMLPDELAIQRQGYASALTDSRVVEAMLAGPNGRIALAFVEWAGVHEQNIVIPWTILDSPAAVEAFARRIGTGLAPLSHRTSVSAALDFAASMFDGNGIDSAVRIIDISGDGTNNQGGPVVVARNAAVARGITINGLVLLSDDGTISAFEIPDLDAYYANCVIGGPGAFSVMVNSWEEFADAVRSKLLREIAESGRIHENRQPSVQHVTAPPSAYDCLIGEKLWAR
jgi:hypothetical protein